MSTVVYAVHFWPKRRYAARTCTAYRFLPAKSETNKTLGTPKVSQEHDNEMGLQEIDKEAVNKIYFALNKDWRGPFVSNVNIHIGCTCEI